jgi:hypothetical protein
VRGSEHLLARKAAGRARSPRRSASRRVTGEEAAAAAAEEVDPTPLKIWPLKDMAFTIMAFKDMA